MYRLIFGNNAWYIKMTHIIVRAESMRCQLLSRLGTAGTSWQPRQSKSLRLPAAKLPFTLADWRSRGECFTNLYYPDVFVYEASEFREGTRQGSVEIGPGLRCVVWHRPPYWSREPLRPDVWSRRCCQDNEIRHYVTLMSRLSHALEA